jgi:hypothetical protein
MSDGSCHFILCGRLLSAGSKQPQCAEFKQIVMRNTPKSQVGFRLAYMAVPNSPVTLDDVVSGGTRNLIRSATAHNMSDDGIRAFRIGWLLVSADGTESSESISEDIPLPKIVKSHSLFSLPAKKLHLDNISAGSLVTFYVAEVSFGSGKRWEADTQELKSKLTPNASRAALSGDLLRVTKPNLLWSYSK